MRDAVILTVFNRSELALTNTLIALLRNDLSDTEILFVDDGSTKDYSKFRERLENLPHQIRWERVSTVEECPSAYNIDGHNNPAYVNNKALAMLDCERVFWLSSDIILPNNALYNARIWDADRYVYVPDTVDMLMGQVFNGKSRFFPMMWFVGTSWKRCMEVGFDERYLEGMAFEDNDFMGGLALATGSIVVDHGVTVWHQPHNPVAYSDNLEGFKRSERYTLEKWGGVPFSSREKYQDPLEINTEEVMDCWICKTTRKPTSKLVTA